MSGSNDEQKAVLLSAVGILGHPAAVHSLEQVILSQSQSTFVRTKAIFAYKRLIFSTNGK